VHDPPSFEVRNDLLYDVADLIDLLIELLLPIPGIGSEIHARHPVMVQATCTFIPVVLRFPEYSSGCALHDQHGSSVPSTM